MNLHIFNTIRFKLAATYAGVIFVCFAAFLLIFNMYMRSYFLQPLDQDQINITGRPILVDTFRKLQKAEQRRILEIRTQDFQSIQTISLIALLPIAVVSIIAGYFLTEEYLSPLHMLNKRISSRTSENLGEKIDYEGPDDEVGQIIASFNQMANRLHGDFEMQSQFIQDASHEIKTPLAVLQTNIELVLDNFGEKSMEHKALSNALSGISRLDELLDDLLMLSHSDKERDDVVLNSLITELSSELNDYAQNHAVELKIDLPNDDVIVSGNGSDLYRALRNIVENGIKYSQSSKKPAVNFSLSVKNFKGEQFAQITISDNGPGIPTKDLPRIFDRFYRVDKSRNSKAGGNGLGLAIAKKIVEEHGGSIDVKSTSSGTTFKINL